MDTAHALAAPRLVPDGAAPRRHEARTALQRRVRRPTALLALLDARLEVVREVGRIYEALAARHASADLVGRPTESDLERMRDDQLRRVGLLERAIRQLGGVRNHPRQRPALPTGRIYEILADPRATLHQSLEAIVASELVTSDVWMVLADLTAEAGRHELAASFTRAMAEEDGNLEAMRGWIRSLAGARTRG